MSSNAICNCHSREHGALHAGWTTTIIRTDTNLCLWAEERVMLARQHCERLTVGPQQAERSALIRYKVPLEGCQHKSREKCITQSFETRALVLWQCILSGKTWAC